MALKKNKKRFLNLQVSVAEPEIHFRRNNSSQIMFSAPCIMCQAFVWHLLLARQTNLKILGGGKIKKNKAGEVLRQSVVSVLAGMTVPLSLEAVSALSTPKMLFPGLILT